MFGYVWLKGKVVFLDFLKNEMCEYWKDLIVSYYINLLFDGLWIDMNELVNFGINEEWLFNWLEKDKFYWFLKCLVFELDDFLYKLRGVFGFCLLDKILCMVVL